MQNTDILNNINIIAEKLFKSVESQVFDLLDNIVVISADILKKEPLKDIFFQDKINGFVLIANSLVIFYIVYYVFSEIFSMYNGNKNSNIYSFIIRLIFVLLFVNSSYYICSEILNILDVLTSSIDSFCKSLCGKDVSFINLKENILSLDDFMKNEFLSVDGIIKGVISFGAFSILINFSIRYVTIIFLIVISPFSFISLCSQVTSGFFTIWWKMLITNLSTQIIVKILLLIPIIYKDTSSVMYKIVLVGTIYLIYKLNVFIKEIFVKVSTVMPSFNSFSKE